MTVTRPPSPPSKPRLYRSLLCPYAQRTAWALIANGVDHEIVDIDLANKPEWYPEVNPRSKVPALELPDGKILIESSEIVWFIEEGLSKGKSLLPREPYARYQARYSVSTFQDKYIPAFYAILRNSDATEKVALNSNLLAALKEFLETFPPEGPSKFTTVLTYPWISRLAALSYWRGLEIPKTAEYEAFWKWKEATEKDEGFVKSQPSDEVVIAALGKWAKEKL